MRTSPNQKTRDWNQIFLFFCFLLAIFYSGMLLATWDFITGWGSFFHYSKYFISLLKSVLNVGDGYYWGNYWRWIEENNLYIHFYTHLIVPFVISFFSSYKLTKLAFFNEGSKDLSNHIEGARLYYGKGAINKAIKVSKKIIRKEGRKSKGVKIHPAFRITKVTEQANIGVYGTSGSGKTTVILQIIYQALARGDRAFIYDKKREFTSYFLDKFSILIAPWDLRSHAWDISRDLYSKDDAITVANNLIPESKSQDPMWVKAARLIFAAILISLMNEERKWGWKEIAQRLTISQGEMLSLLQNHYPIAATFFVENSKTTQGFYVNLISELSWIENLAVAWGDSKLKQFSIREWILSKDKKTAKTVIVQSDDRYEAVGAPICSALISLMTTYFLSQPQKNAKPTWLFVDELANLPVNKDLIRWLELARSRGGRTLIGTQSISQIKSVYGDHDADTILNLISTSIALRVGAAGDESRYISNVFGERLVDRPSTHLGDKTWTKASEPVVAEHELVQLDMPSKKGVSGFIMIPSWNSVFKLIWPYFNRKKVAEEQVIADWVNARPQPKSKNSGNRLFGDRSL